MRKPLGRQKLKVGDVVLLGMPGVSLPGDWFIGEVVWFDADHVLVYQSHIGGGGKSFPQLHGMDYVRAIGTVEELGEIRSRVREAVAEFQKYVRSAESMLNDAREAVWARLDEFAAAEPMRSAGDGI
jgi:hypothetical protein